MKIPSVALILMAGNCSRFAPFNNLEHKSFFQICGKSIIAWTIESLLALEVKRVVIVHRQEDSSAITKLTQMYPQIQFTLVIQTDALGMGQAILSAKQYLTERFILLNPQQLNVAEHLANIASQNLEENANVCFTQPTQTPHVYGMVALNGKQITKIIEKPTNLDGLSNQRLLGIYFLQPEILQIIEAMEITPYQFEVALDHLALEGKLFACESLVQGLTLKYAWNVFEISQYILSQNSKEPVISPEAFVHPTAIITGNVFIEKNAKIMEYTLLQGPVYIGVGALVGSYSKVRNNTILEENVELQNGVEVKNSLIGKNTHLHSGFVGDSLIGENCRFGAGFITANRRLDRQNISVMIDDKKVDSGRSFLGALIGESAKIGIHCGTNPGRVIANNQIVYPGTIL